MRQLPEELLCTHCCDPDTFPEYEDNQRKEGQQALAKLCRTSRQFARLAQPILHHCFADRNYYRMTPEGRDPHRHPPGWSPSYPLPLLLQTLLRRPDLAYQVCAMRLCTTWKPNPNKETHFLSWNTREAFSAVVRWAKDNDILEPIDEVLSMYNIVDEEGWPRPNDDAHGSVDGSHTDFYDQYGLLLNTWMAFYGTTLCPRLETLSLLFGCPFTDTMVPLDVFVKQPGLRLSSLRKLALESLSPTWHPCIFTIIRLAPNLESLYIPDYLGTVPLDLDPPEIRIHNNGRRSLQATHMSIDSPTQNTALPVTSLKSLSIVDVDFEIAEDLFHKNPRLETVVIYTDELWDLSAKLDFSPLQETLTSLCICSQHTWGLEEYHGRWDFGSYGTDWDMMWEAGRSTRSLWPEIRDLSSLKHLAIDCSGLSGPRNSAACAPDYLVDILPPNIRTLRIGWVYMSLQEQVTYLADVAPTEFPNLRKIGVGIAENRPAAQVNEVIAKSLGMPVLPVEGPICPTTALEYPAVLYEMESIGEMFASVGIDFAWMQDWLFIRVEQIVPLRRENKTPAMKSLPAFPLDLDGPEWYRAGDTCIRDGTMDIVFDVYQVEDESASDEEVGFSDEESDMEEEESNIEEGSVNVS